MKKGIHIMNLKSKNVYVTVLFLFYIQYEFM